MKIQAVMVDGYKNLSAVKLFFDKITALVALNNYGKSNVLSAIDFGLEFIKASNEDKKLMMASSNLFPINKEIVGRNYRFELDGLFKTAENEYQVLYDYEFAWKIEERVEPYILSESLRMRANSKGSKFTQLIDRKLTDATYKSSETGRCTSKINIESSELVVNKLRAFDDIFYIETIKEINSMRFYMENSLDAKRYHRPDPIILNRLEDIAINSDNLPRVIFQLQEKAPKKYELLKNVYMNLFPEVEDIMIKRFNYNYSDSELNSTETPLIISNSVYVLFVKDKNLVQMIDFAMMSDGAKRMFMILTRIILASIANVSLIAIEEPENSIHPSLFRDYIQMINQLLDDCKILITSHSPYIINYLNPKWIYVGMSMHHGIAEFYPFNKTGQRSLEQDANKLDMSTGDYLFSMLSDEDSNWKDYLEIPADE